MHTIVLCTHQTGGSDQSTPRTAGDTVNSTDLIVVLSKVRIRNSSLDDLQSMSSHMSDTHMSERLAELTTSALPRTDGFSATVEHL